MKFKNKVMEEMKNVKANCYDSYDVSIDWYNYECPNCGWQGNLKTENGEPSKKIVECEKCRDVFKVVTI